jgi:hypothetical protein
VIENVFYNKHICGVRGGLPFKKVIRPDFKTGKCPQGTQKCSKATNNNNTVCYKDLSLCPITQLVFAAPNSKKNKDDKELHFNKHKNLYWSKTVKNALPITSTRVDGKPCANPNDKSKIMKNNIFYPLEKDRKQGCKKLIPPAGTKLTKRGMMRLKYDYRYQPSGLKISEYQL